MTTKLRNEAACASTVWIAIKDLLIDPVVQRRFRPAWAADIAENLDPGRLGIIHVSKRHNSKYYIIDGQHRVAAVRTAWKDETQMMECKVYEGLTKPQEAALFLALNHTRAVSRMDRFFIAVEAKDPIPVAITRIVSEAGFTVSTNQGDHLISAVGSLQLVYMGFCDNGSRRDTPQEETKAKPDLLRGTLRLIGEAWGGVADSCNGYIIEGLGRILSARQKVLDLSDLAHKLKTFPGGPGALVGKARGRLAMMGGKLGILVAEEVIATYNKGKSKGKIEPLR